MMAVKRVEGLWPESRIVVRIEAVSTHHYFAVSNRRFGDEGSIRGGDKYSPPKRRAPTLPSVAPMSPVRTH